MIVAQNLRKTFKKTIKEAGIKGSIKSLFNPQVEKIVAVKDISFEVDKGEILGLIGPNGAGKSTVIKMLAGILTPTSGYCSIEGRNPQNDRKNYVREIGVVFGQRTQLWWDLPLRETYGILKEIYEVPDEQFKKRISFLNDVLELEKFISSPVRTLSLGQRMRADLAASMLHSPKVLFLDEPTIGLDVVVKENIRQAINYINEHDQTTILLTTHDLADIEKMSNRIVMVDQGSDIFNGTIFDLKKKYGKIRELNFESETEKVRDLLNYTEYFKIVNSEFKVEFNDRNVKVRFNSDLVSVAEVVSYTLQKVCVRDIVVNDSDIEEIIRYIYKQEK